MIFRDWRDFLPERTRLKQAGQALVITNGCFDLLHPGHLRLLEQARRMGDALLVAINTDASVRQMKGEARPIVPQDERAELLDALEFVNYVAGFAEPTPRELIDAIRPEILVKGADWGTNEIVGRETVEGAGGRVVRIELEPGYSTSGIVDAVLRTQRA